MPHSATYISNIQKFCTHDGPGIRTNVFFKGCTMRCQWCANPETISRQKKMMYFKSKCTGCGRCVDVCPEGAISFKDGKSVQDFSKCRDCGLCVEACLSEAREINGEMKTPQKVFECVDQDKVFYEQSGGGVTFSGGEPLLHPAFIRDVAEKCRAEGYTTAVETCGNFDMDTVKDIVDLIDYFLFDIKIIDERKHQKYCGQPNTRIHANFDYLLMERNADVTPRVPIIPGVNDGPEDIAALCGFLGKYKEKIEKVHILPYHNLAMGKYDALGQKYQLEDLQPPSKEHMNTLKASMEARGFKVVIGG